MPRRNTVKRIASDICLSIESYLGQTADFRFMEMPIEKAVRSCLRRGEEAEEIEDPVLALAQRIRGAVQSVLTDYEISEEWTNRLGIEIDRAILITLRGRRLHLA